MSRNWIKLLRWIGTREHYATSSGFLYQDANCSADNAANAASGKADHPTWLIPAYLRRHRSGDRMYR